MSLEIVNLQAKVHAKVRLNIAIGQVFMEIKITKAVFPVAGFGTRFLPATKAMPKELLPVVDKPLIQYAVEEAISAGINTLIFDWSLNVPLKIISIVIKSWKLRCVLKVRMLRLKWLRIFSTGGRMFFVRQPEQLGLGHAVLCAERAVVRTFCSYIG